MMPNLGGFDSMEIALFVMLLLAGVFAFDFTTDDFEPENPPDSF